MGTRTRSNLKTDLKHMLQESGYNYWTEAIVNRKLDDAHGKVALDSGFLEQTHKAAVTSGTREYAFPAGFAALRDVYWNQEPIDVVEPEWLDQHDSDWRTTTGDAPTHATVENGNLSLYPTPNATAAALTTPLRIKILAQPAAFSTDNSTIEVPDFLFEAMLYFAAHLCWQSYDKVKSDSFLSSYEFEMSKWRKMTKAPEGRAAQRRANVPDRKTGRANY